MIPTRQRIILLGPPASGKGTQAQRIAETFAIPHVSTGALLREESAKGTVLGREADSYTSLGHLVPDDLAVRLIASWMAAHGPRFLLDGFPRTVGQAHHLDAELARGGTSADLVVFLDLPEEEIRRRILNRLTCEKCGTTYGASLHGLEAGNACPRCGATLIRRRDDTEEALNERLRVYREATLPVVEHYRTTDGAKFHTIDAARGSDEIFGELSALVSTNRL